MKNDVKKNCCTLLAGLLVANGSGLAGVVELPIGCHHQGKVSARPHLTNLLVHAKVHLIFLMTN